MSNNYFSISFIILLITHNVFIFSQQVFIDVSADVGIADHGQNQNGPLGLATSWGDIDNDGFLDLAFSDNDGGFFLYKNDNGFFNDITATSGLSSVTGNKILWIEVTGDEYNDLVVNSNSGQKIYQNDGDQSFSLINSSLLGRVTDATDFNNDGNLDLLSIYSTDIIIYFGNGDGNFTNSVSYSGSFATSTCLDYNNDGLIDFYLGGNSLTYETRLYKNNGDETFTDVTLTAGVNCNLEVSAVISGDYDNDGYIDLYLGVHGSQIEDPSSILLKNNGDGTFSDVTVSAGNVSAKTSTRTAAFIDYNNDGFLDIHVVDHYPNFNANLNHGNSLYENNGDGTFTDVALEVELTDTYFGHADYFGMGWADYNNDGALDLFGVGHLNYSGDMGDGYRLFENTDCTGNYLTLNLQGENNAHNAIGSKITVQTDEMEYSRFLNASTGMNGFNSLRVHLGLGNSEVVNTIVIDWPDGTNTTINGPISANQIINVSEDGVGIKGNYELSIMNYELKQNYPNPFNPTTKINYTSAQLSVNQLVEVVVYNTMGQQVWSSGNLPFTIHHSPLHFDGSNLNSGIYYYSLFVDGKKISTKSMVLIK